MKKVVLSLLVVVSLFMITGCGVFRRAERIINRAEKTIDKIEDNMDKIEDDIDKVGENINKEIDEAGRLTLIDEIAIKMANSAKIKLISGEFALPINSDDVTIINIDMLDLNTKYFSKSKYVNTKSYVIVTNEGTDEVPYYKYYVSYQDEDGYALPLTAYDEINIGKVVKNARNKMEVTIQSICGTKAGEYETINIPALNSKVYNATVYSKECK